MHFLRLFYPKGWIGWGLLAMTIYSFCLHIGPKLINPKGLLLLIALASIFWALWFACPVPWIERWESVHPLVRCCAFALGGYVVPLTIGNFGELYRFHLWYEFLIPGGASPLTPTHSVAFLSAAYAFAVQFYGKPGPPAQDSEQVLPGQPHLISFEEAQRKANENINN